MALLRSSFTVGIWTLASRILGFVRDMLIARYLGTTGVVEAFVVAFRFPNFFRRLVAEGAFTAAFVPLFAARLEAEGRQAALRFADMTLALLLAVLVVFTILAEIFMPWLLVVVAPGFKATPELYDTAVLFTRLTLPYLLCMALVALFSGMLNSTYRFAAAAAAPILLNVILIAGLLWAQPWFETPGHLLSAGVAVAGVGQFIWLAIALNRAGLSLRLPRPRITAEIRQLLRLMVPGAIGAGMTQINLLVGTIIATFIPGAVSYLYFADRVYQFPLGMIGIAIGTALLPDLSRKIQRDEAEAVGVHNRAVELAMLLTLPATAALIVAAAPIVTVLFQHGAFDAAASGATAAALAAFSLGLPAYVLIKILNPGFYARRDTVTPVRFAVASMIANIVLSLALVFPLEHVGIALATAIAAWLNAGLLWASLIRRGHFTADRALRRRLPRIVISALVMAAVLVPLSGFLGEWFAAGVMERAAAMAALVAAGMVVFFAMAFAIGATDVGAVRRILQRALRRRGAA